MVFKNLLSKSKDIDILSNLPDGVVLTDADGKIHWCNDVAAKLFGISKSELTKRNLMELIDGGLDLAKQAAINAQSAVGKARNDEHRESFFEIACKYAEDFLIVTLRDVSQSYKTVTNILMEHEYARKICKDKNAFLIKLSNELKSPIHSILGFSQAMVDGLGGEMSEKQEKYIKIINKNSNEVLYFMDKILELSKTESNLMDYDFQIFDCVNAVQQAVKGFEQMASEKNLNLSFEVEEGFKKTAYSVESALKLILQNILESAIKATDIGSVSVGLFHPSLDLVRQSGLDVPENASEKAYLMLTVADTGAGILEGDLEVLFEPYAQLDRANKKNIVRSIALASAKNVVSYLKGKIWAESEAMQGTTYNIILPVERWSDNIQESQPEPIEEQEIETETETATEEE